MSSFITHELLENAMNYPAYVEMVRDQYVRREITGNGEFTENFLEDLMITALTQIDSLMTSAQLNQNTLKALRKQQMPLIWLAITEGWCVDSAHSLPIIYKMSETNPNIEMKIILRDAPPKIIDNFLTRGSRSIPKVICLDAESLVVLGTWGPRPIELQVKIMLKNRAVNKLFNTQDEARAEDIGREMVAIMNEWYQQNQTESIQTEIIQNLMY